MTSATVKQPIDAAAEYLRQGLRVMPLCWPRPDGRCACGHRPAHEGKNVGKAPLLGPGWQKTRPSEGDVRRWWGARPANIGLILDGSGVLVVDLDSADALSDAQALGLPTTPGVATSGHGQHHYYRLPVGGPVAREIHLGPSGKVDVLSSGYIILPPSRHREGRNYAWLSGESPEFAKLPAAPAWAVEALWKKVAAASHGGGASTTGGAPPGGPPLPLSERLKTVLRSGFEGHYPSRSEAVFALVSGMIRCRWSDEQIVSAITEQPWAVRDKPDPAAWVLAEVGRARAKGAAALPLGGASADLAPLPAAEAAASLQARVGSLRTVLRLAEGNDQEFAAGMVAAFRAGVDPRALLTLSIERAALRGAGEAVARDLLGWAMWAGGGERR